VSHKKVTPALAAEPALKPPPVNSAPKLIVKPIPRKTPPKAQPKEPEDSEPEKETYLSSHSTNLLEDSSDRDEAKSPLLSKPSPTDFYYGSHSWASLLILFDK
jgi:hypothetical protein